MGSCILPAARGIGEAVEDMQLQAGWEVGTIRATVPSCCCRLRDITTDRKDAAWLDQIQKELVRRRKKHLISCRMSCIQNSVCTSG